MIEEVLDALGIARVGVAGYEADDVIGTLATRDAGAGRHRDRRPRPVPAGRRRPRVRVLYTAGVGSADVVDEAAVAAKYGIPGRAYADFATLRGDPSDGLPGCAGHRRQDRGRADHRVRRPRRRCWRQPLDASDAGFPAGARAKLHGGRRLPGVRPDGGRGSRATCRCRRTTTGLRPRAARPGPAGRAGRPLGARTARSTGCCSRRRV